MRFPSTSRSEPKLGASGIIAALLLTLNRFSLAYQLDPNSTSELHCETVAEPLGTCPPDTVHSNVETQFRFD
jgi:hypothetical protein